MIVSDWFIPEVYPLLAKSLRSLVAAALAPTVHVLHGFCDLQLCPPVITLSGAPENVGPYLQAANAVAVGWMIE